MRWPVMLLLALAGCRFEPGSFAHDGGDGGGISDVGRDDASDPMLDAGVVVVPACTLVLGSDHSCARRAADGTFHCVGNNSNGELGRGSTSGSSTTVMQVAVGAVTAMAGRSYHACIATADGAARCWGENAAGQLGDGSTTDRRSPVQVMDLANVVELAAARAFTCARRQNGSVTCWGSNSSGQLGDNTTDDRTTPATTVMGLPAAPIALAAGSSHACALFAGGTGACWGSNVYGQLGDGTQDNRRTAVTMPVNAIKQIAAGGYSTNEGAGGQTCTLHLQGTVSCWGSNNFGQLGIGTTSSTPSLSPVTVSGITDGVELTMGRYHVCVRHGVGGGTVSCWGRNANGQLGDGSATDRVVPTVVALPGPAVHVVGGGFHTCAVLADDSVYCWGLGSSGQLGTGNTTSQRSPTPSNLCP
jgi:alpha-tubulin suppressor-like RCC1 family protein